MTPSELLATACAQLEGGEHVASALESLIDAWNLFEHPAIADAIDVVSKEVTAREPPIATVGKVSARQAWVAAAKTYRVATYPRLLEALPFGREQVARIRVICAMERRDPRFTAFAKTWLTIEPPAWGRSRKPFFMTVVEILDKDRDVRILPTLRDLVSEAKAGWTTIRTEVLGPLVELHKKLETFATVLPDLPETDRAMLLRIEALIAKEHLHATSTSTSSTTSSDPDAMFARVYANPSDDEARAVLGDLLQQRGDPRGEHIALQLARADQSQQADAKATLREREIEERWGRTWLGPLEPIIARPHLVYERGFLTRCELLVHALAKYPDVHEHDVWSTVTHILVGSFQMHTRSTNTTELLTSPKMRSLRSVLHLDAQELEEIIGTYPLPWTEVGLCEWTRSAVLLGGPRGRLDEVKRLVALGRSGELGDDDIATILRLWSKVEHLEMGVDVERVRDLLLSPHVRRLARCVALTGDFAMELTEKRSELRITFLSFIPAVAARAVATVSSLLDGAREIRRISVTGDGWRTSSPRKVKAQGKHMLVHGRSDKLDLSALHALAVDRDLGWNIGPAK